MAVEIFRELVGRGDAHEARAVGTAPGASRRLRTRELAWAEVVAVMEEAHLAEIRRHWPDQVGKVRVLGIPDDYDPEESELRELLRARVRALLDDLGPARSAPDDPARRPVR